MASGGSKSIALILLVLNLGLYFIVTIIAGWAANHGIDRSHETTLPTSGRIFPIYFPFGNTATGFFVIFSLIAGVVGIATSLTGLTNVLQSSVSSLNAAAVSSFLSWALTILSMGLACKEINIGFTDSNLRTLEVITIITSATQLFCTGALHAGASEVSQDQLQGRV